MSSKQNRRAAERKGRFVENLALLLFLFKGYWPLARRYRTKRGEIDLILRRGSLLVFLEVKLRSDHETAAHAISPSQKRRIEDAAQIFLSSHPHLQNLQLRFDAMLFSPRPRHISDAFRASGEKM